MLATLRQRDFSLLWFAGLISVMGNWMLAIALPVVIYEMTGSALAVGGLLLARTLPAILFSSVAGVFVDRWERRRTLIVINLLLAVAVLPLLLVHSSEMLWLVYVVTFVQTSLAQFFNPAENAFLPLLSDPKYLVSANALNALNNNLARLIGPAVGGIILTVAGLNGVVWIDALTYLVAAGLCALIHLRSQPARNEAPAPGLRQVYADWRAGLAVIWRERQVRLLMLLQLLPSASEQTMATLFVPFVTTVLGGDAVVVGGLVSAQAVGGLFGSLVVGGAARRLSPALLIGLGGVGIGLADLLLFNYHAVLPGLAPAYLMFVLAGPCAVGYSTGFLTLIQTNVPDAYRGRAFGAFSLTDALVGVAGIAIAGLADEVGIVPVINFQAVAYFLAGIGALVLLREAARRVSEPASGD